MTANTPADTPKKSPYADIDISWYEPPHARAFIDSQGNDLTKECLQAVLTEWPDIVDLMLEVLAYKYFGDPECKPVSNSFLEEKGTTNRKYFEVIDDMLGEPMALFGARSRHKFKDRGIKQDMYGFVSGNLMDFIKTLLVKKYLSFK